jgi:hypothetical protein
MQPVQATPDTGGGVTVLSQADVPAGQVVVLKTHNSAGKTQ